MVKKQSQISRRDFIKITGVAGLTTILAACAPNIATQIIPGTATAEQPTGVSNTPAPTPNPTAIVIKKGGKLTIALNGDTKTLDPHVSQLFVWQIARRCSYEQLIRPDGKGGFTGYLATGYTQVDNVTTDFTLRTDVVFHNGEKFTADDVKYTFDRLAVPNLPSQYPGWMTSLDKVEVLAPDKVRITQKYPDVTLLSVISDFDIISKSVPYDKLATTMVGTGGFKLAEWLPNEHLKFVKFDQYYMPGQPYLDEVDWVPMPDAQGRIASLLAGQIDIDYEIALKDIPSLASQSGIQVKKLIGGLIWVTYLNIATPPFNDLRIRQALLYGFNRDLYNQKFDGGFDTITNSPIAPTNFAYNPDVDKMYPYDKNKALSLIAEAGYNASNPLSLEIIYPVGLGEYDTMTNFFQSQMSDLGVNVKVTGMELAAWSNKIVKERSYQIAIDSRFVELTEPANPYNDWTFTKPDPNNLDHFDVNTIPGYMDLIKQGYTETDPATRKGIYMKLQQLWVDNLPGWYLFVSPNMEVARDYVVGYDYWGLPPWRLFEVWLNKKA